MAALTGDNRFEEAYYKSQKEGVETRNMEEILDKVENRGVQRGIQQGLIVLIKKKMLKNMSISEIADALEETEDDVREIYDTIQQMGMSSSEEEIYKRLHPQD